eukprot:365574-Chlamydomonas_euryale.AAC.7
MESHAFCARNSEQYPTVTPTAALASRSSYLVTLLGWELDAIMRSTIAKIRGTLILDAASRSVLFVPLPPPAGRVSILRALTRKTPLAPDADLAAIGYADRCSGFSGADMAALVREACVMALKETLVGHEEDRDSALQRVAAGSAGCKRQRAPDESIPLSPLVHMRHFEAALSNVAPSVSKRDLRMYEALRYRLRASRSQLTDTHAAASMPVPLAANGDAATLPELVPGAPAPESLTRSAPQGAAADLCGGRKPAWSPHLAAFRDAEALDDIKRLVGDPSVQHGGEAGLLCDELPTAAMQASRLWQSLEEAHALLANAVSKGDNSGADTVLERLGSLVASARTLAGQVAVSK